mgnify:CR=1 FL=1
MVIGNRITDAMQIDENHSDGFQAFKIDGLLDGIVIKDNVLIEWTVRPDNPLRAKMQGISFHNGPYANVVIRDNAVATRAPNGMHLNAVRNLEVIGNRVRHADRPTAKGPWIRVHQCSGRIVVEDNQAEQINQGLKLFPCQGWHRSRFRQDHAELAKIILRKPGAGIGADT